MSVEIIFGVVRQTCVGGTAVVGPLPVQWDFGGEDFQPVAGRHGYLDIEIRHDLHIGNNNRFI